jgi:RHS repeat-associated protein
MQPRRVLIPALIAVMSVLTLAGSTHGASAQKPTGLPGSSAQSKLPPLQKNQAGADLRRQRSAKDASQVGILSVGGGTSTPLLDDFNRANGNLCSDPAWSCTDPRGQSGWLSVLGERAGSADSINRVSYRHQDYPGNVELYATIPVKPATGGSLALAFNIRQVGSDNWDAYWLTWDVHAGTDILRFEKIVNNGATPNIVSIPLEMSAGDSFMARRVGAQLEGWVNQDGTWIKVLEGTDAEFVGGKFGLFARGSVQRIDDLGGGPYQAPLPPAREQSIGTCGIGVHAYSRSACRGTGVNTLTGAFTTQVVDLALPGIGVPFRWMRTYSSDGAGMGGLGPGWTHSFATRVAEQELLLTLGQAATSAQGENDFKLFGDEGQEILYVVDPNDGTFTGAPGSLSTLHEVADGHEVLTKDQVLYKYNTFGRLTSIKDRNGQGLTIEYQEPENPHRLARIVDSVGREITIGYTGELLTSVTLEDGRSVQYAYTDGRMTSMVDARGETTTYRYDAAGRLDRIVDIVDELEQQVVRNEYDSETGRVSMQWDAHEELTTFEGDPDAGGDVTMTDAREKEWVDVYDGGVIDERRNPLGETTEFEYDLDLNVTQISDPRQNTTFMEYDDAGNLEKRTTPAPFSDVEEWLYNARNDVDLYTDPRGNQTDYEYDNNGNLNFVEQPHANDGDPEQPVTRYEPDPVTGLVEAIVDPRDKRTEFEYDEDGNLRLIRSPEGHETTMSYDPVSGQLETLVDPRGNELGGNPADFTWNFEFNAHDQLHKQFDPFDHLTELRYDQVGNLEKRIDAKNHETVYTYWESNRLKSVTAPDPDGPEDPLLSPVTQYEYDPVGNLKKVTDAEERDIVYEYDDANRLSMTTAPKTDTESRVWTYEYDESGNPDFMVDPNGNATVSEGDGLTDYGYDELNRLESISYSDSTPNVTFVYDENGRRTQMTDGAGTESYDYDELNRLETVTRGSTTFSYSYDLASNLTQRTYPGGAVVDATYDDDGHLDTIASNGITSYDYDAAGNLQTTTLPSANGHVETRQYDEAGRLDDLEHTKNGTTLARFAAVLDPVGNPEQIVRTGAHPLTQTYSYDNLDRLTGVCFQAATCGAQDPFINWTYDKVGNRKTETRPAGTTTYQYNDGDELEGRSGLGGSVTYTYDQNGNQLTEGAKTFEYDLADRMTEATSGTADTTYSYDGVGKRLQAVTEPPPSVPSVRTPCPTAIGTSNIATVAKPTGTVAGDLLIVGLAFEKGSDAQTPTPTGWTLILRTTQSSNVGYATFRKVAGASEPANYSFTLTNSPKWSIGICAIAGANTSAPIVSLGASNSSGNPVAPSVNTGGPDRLVLAFYANKKPTMFNGYTTPPPVSERWDRPNSAGGLPSNAMISYTPAAGLTGTKTAIAGEAAEWVAQQIAIAPGVTTSTTKFLWDINHAVPQIALERDAADVDQRRYLYGHQRIAQTAGTPSYYHTDTLGSVAHLTSDTGTTQRTLAYEPFGIERTNTGPGLGTPFKFTGEYHDATGLYHLRARQYDPETGRFLSRDPIASAGSAYAYAANNPLVYNDPTGAFPWPNLITCPIFVCGGGSESAHLSLELAGLIPLAGEAADLINCAWYEAEGDHLAAGLSCGAALPFLGWAAAGAKLGKRTAELPLFSQRTASGTFGHGPLSGQTIGSVAAGLRSGEISPAMLPVNVIRRDGELLAMNTRSTLALRRGGIDVEGWVIRDVTGVPIWERRLTERLLRNQMTGGSPFIRITGAGPNASWIR